MEFDEKRLQAQMILCGISVEKLSELLGINKSTFYRKMKNNGDFSRVEILKMIDILKIDDPISIFFSDNVA
jgi:hypothetical protein